MEWSRVTGEKGRVKGRGREGRVGKEEGMVKWSGGE